MKIVATDIPKTIEDYQIALNAAFEGGKAYGAAVAKAEEREACAKVCDDEYFAFVAADTIRARGEK